MGRPTWYDMAILKTSAKMVVVHIVLFKFRPEVTDEQKNTFVNETRTLRGLSCVLDGQLRVGGPSITNPIERSKGFHYALVSCHPDSAALEEYQQSAEHHRYVCHCSAPTKQQLLTQASRITSTYMWPFAEDVMRFDFEVEKADDVACLGLPALAPSLS